MTRDLVTLNAGSSSIKYALFELTDEAPRLIAAGLAEMVGTGRYISVRDATGGVTHEDRWDDGATPFHADALHRIIAWLHSAFPQANIVAVGHRVAHGGVYYAHPVIVTDAVLVQLRALIPLAPLHQPHNIAGIEAAREAWPDMPQVTCFDTAFHRAHAFVNDVFALPRHFYDEGVRSYGFHGLSYEYIMVRLREIAPLHAAGRVVVAHLGSGASMCAIRDGLSVASTMGFTALDGLPMGTRCGQIDPGVLLYLLQEKGMSAAAIADLLYRESGLKGLSGESSDMRDLEVSNSREAAEAIAYFVFRIRRELGGLAATLSGLDAMVFCGGIGENDWRVRESVLEDMQWIGIELDRTANRASAQVISTDFSRVRVFVIPTDEEAMIARDTVEALEREARKPRVFERTL